MWRICKLVELKTLHDLESPKFCTKNISSYAYLDIKAKNLPRISYATLCLSMVHERIFHD